MSYFFGLSNDLIQRPPHESLEGLISSKIDAFGIFVKDGRWNRIYQQLSEL